jgi:8-oxo-dGTP pyrophosphatase MutT (NUDIX family)
MMTLHDDQHWELTRSEAGPELPLFKTRLDWYKNPRNAADMRALVLEAADWANVVALTPEKKILVVRQYRFGIGKFTTEIPAGLIEPGEPHAEAARRELAEETGYIARAWQYLGWVQANPAFMDNLCHMWLALDVTLGGGAHLDDGENIQIAEMSLEEVRQQIRAGEMRNSMTLLALSRVFDLRDI